jgi:hypothetical protein
MGGSVLGRTVAHGRVVAYSQKPLMDLKNLQFLLEDRDYSKIN